MSLDLDIGRALGPLHLGAPLHHLLALFRVARDQWPHIAIEWDEQSPNRTPVLLTVRSPPITLLFDGVTQLLHLIEVADPGAWVTFRGRPLTVDDGSATKRALSRLFGPADAPRPHLTHATEEDLIVYPGMFFGVSTDPATRHALTRLVVCPICDREPEDPYTTALRTKPLRTPASQIDRAEIRLGQPPELVMHFAAPERSPIAVTLGETTAEDIRIDVGPPARLFVREDERMAVHARGSASTDAAAYFASYFDLGLDFLFQSESHRLLKVVLHSNTPGEALFGQYARLLWTISHDGKTLHSTDTGEHVLAALESIVTSSGLDGTHATSPRPREPPLLLDRTADAPEGLASNHTSELHGLPGITLEVTGSGDIETCWLFAP